MGSNTYAILKYPLVHPTYGTISDYTYTSSTTYDHFFMNEGENNYWVYIVKKLTSGFTKGTSGSSSYTYSGGITSYYRFGQLRTKHHIFNSYSLYLLMKPSTKIYSCSTPKSFIDGYRISNYFGTWSI